ncbi:MAG: hypothetical protein ACJ8G1_05640 [Vitreoscilla sp.]
MMIEHTPRHPTGNPPAAPQPEPPEPAARVDRVDWLFRDSLRRHQVHPLMELLRRYRDQERP